MLSHFYSSRTKASVLLLYFILVLVFIIWINVPSMLWV